METHFFGHELNLLSLMLKSRFCQNTPRQIHSKLLTTGVFHWCRLPIASGKGVSLWNTLVQSYSLSCHPEDALLLYNELVKRSCCDDFSNCPLSSYLRNDSFTFSSLLKACANGSRIREGVQIHGLTLKKGFICNPYVQTALINMYMEFRYLSEGLRVFDACVDRNPVTWNTAITGLIKWGDIGTAQLLFDRMPNPNIISWTAMIDGYTREDVPHEALALFRDMLAKSVKPTQITILAAAPAISNLHDLGICECIHAYCLKTGPDMADIRVSNCLIDMYAKCGSVQQSLKVFDQMSGRRNVVSWTSAISSLATHGMAQEAVKLLKEMEAMNITPNRVTFLTILNACSHGGLVEEGLGILANMLDKHGIEPELKHYGCAVDMLGRAGRLEEAERAIQKMPINVSANVILWRNLLWCCDVYGNVEMGQRVMSRIMELESGYGGDYAVLSNIFIGAGRFSNAEEVRKMMNENNAIKMPGQSQCLLKG